MSAERTEELVRLFATERQLANSYMTLAREHLKRARDYEQAIQKQIKRAPLTAKDVKRLQALIETGEVLYDAGAEEDVPF